MNNLSFQNTAGHTGGFSGDLQQNAVQQESSLQGPALDRHIINSLKAQSPLQGWQAQVPPNERVVLIKQIISSLRLIKPPVPQEKVVHVAIHFERRALEGNADKLAYRQECSEKLTKIQETRQKQAAEMQSQPQNMQNMMQQVPSTQGQNLPFPPQLQHQMQASPIPAMQQPHGVNMNQQMGMNMNMNMDGSMGFGANAPRPNTQPQQSQPGFPQPQRPRPNMANPNVSIENLTPQDASRINALAANMARRTSEEQKQKIRDQLRRQNPAFAQEGRDPLGFFFKTQAQKQFRQIKMREIQEMEAGNGGMNGMQLQQSQRPGNVPMGNSQGGLPNSIIGHLNIFQGKQVDGLRSQEAGQLVVPASSTPNLSNMPQQMMRNQQFGQPNITRPMTNANMLSQSPSNIQQMQQMQQNQQMQQMQQRQQNLAGHQFQGQNGTTSVPGGRNTMGFQGMPGQPNAGQPNPQISMLNRPVGPQAQGTPSQGTPQPRQIPQTPVQNSQPGAQSTPNPQVPQVQKPQMPTNLPPDIQRLLQNSRRDQWPEILSQYRQTQIRRMGAQAPNMQQTASQPGNARPVPGGRFPGDNGTGTEPMQQSLSAGPATNQGMNPQLMLEQQQRLRQQAELARRRQEQIPNQHLTPLNENELQFIDQQDVPRQLFNQFPQLPREINSWMQLKQYVGSHPDSQVPIDRINTLQTIHFRKLAHIHKHRNQQLQMPVPQNGHNQATQLPHGLRQDQPQMRGQGPQNMLMAGNRVPQLSPQMLQQLRNKFPGLQGKNDMDIAVIYARHQHQQANNVNQSQARHGSSMPEIPVVKPLHGGPQQADQGVQRQQMNQNPASVANNEHQRQAPQGQIQRPPSAHTGTQPPDRRAAQNASQNTPNQPAARNLKRPNHDVTDTANVAPQPTPAAPSQQNVNLAKPSPQQWNSMSSEEQEKFLRLKSLAQNPEVQERVAKLAKEVAGSMPKPVPLQMMPEERAQIVEKLTNAGLKNMYSRMNPMILQYLAITSDEEGVKELMKQKNYITQQFKDQSPGSKVFEPADHFTINARQLQQYLENIMAKFSVIQSMMPGRNQAQAQAQAQAKARLQAQARAQAQAQGQHQLTPANLQQLQEQQDAQKARRTGNNVPPAPTTLQPPQQLGATSSHTGQGAPIYASPGLKQEDLKFPPESKRRKKTHQTTPTAGPAARPTASPQIPKKTEERNFKCLNDECEFRKKGFASQAELDSHVAETHKKEEHIEDPLAYLLDNAKTAFGLDEQGQRPKKSKTQESKPSQAPSLQKTTSKPGSSATMSREPSKAETGPKAASPASGNIKTLQKLPKPSASVPPAKDKVNAESVKVEPPGQQEIVPDPWNESPMSLGALQETFGDFNMDSNFGNEMSLDNHFSNEMDVDDMMDAFIETDAWTKIQEPKGTPDGSSAQTRSSPAENSDAPTNSDISKGDDLFIHIDPKVPLEDDWLSFDINGDSVNLSNGENSPAFADFELDKLSDGEEEPWNNIDWDAVLAEQAEQKAAAEKAKAHHKRVRR